MPEGSKLHGPVHLTVKENISLEQLQSIIGTIVGLSGCRTCGIMGIDLRLSGEPVEASQIAKLPGVQSVGFGA
ncbi:MAG TPA: hypothetical protein VMV98_09835 [Acidobacteriaceae bacterium]|nr:hypothetical protein [Acidobacteriaceae bacterium]